MGSVIHHGIHGLKSSEVYDSKQRFFRMEMKSVWEYKYVAGLIE